MSTRQGFWMRFSAWLQRNGRWWWTITAAWELGCVVLIDDPWTKTAAAVFVAWCAFWAGWRWREHVAIRRLERLDRHSQRAAADELTRMRAEEGL